MYVSFLRSMNFRVEINAVRDMGNVHLLCHAKPKRSSCLTKKYAATAF